MDDVPQNIHEKLCGMQLHKLPGSEQIKFYLCPKRKISFDGFVNYEGRRFGVPYSYSGTAARVERRGDRLNICSFDIKVLLAAHMVTWSHTDSFCKSQYEEPEQPEEFSTVPVHTQILQLPKTDRDLSFSKFDFDKEDLG